MPKGAILKVQADRKNLARIRDFVEAQAVDASIPPKAINDLIQAADEAATNIIVHGYKDGPGSIEVEVCYQPELFTIILRDSAPVFDPTGYPTPNIHLPLEKRKPGGLGIHLIRQCVDTMTHRPRDKQGNELTLVKHVHE